jgi:1-deoxy-D-xylulose-5-phosphate synthase
MGGAGSAVSEALQAAGVAKQVLHLGLKDEFIEHGDPAKLLALQGLDAAGIEAAVMARFGALLGTGKPGKPALKSVA